MENLLSDDRRRNIGKLLRDRRNLIQPEDVGLPRGKRRRITGLRREEVSSLAGVSVEWYSWLEQARNIRASAETLRRIANVLLLEPSELSLLLRLSGHNDNEYAHENLDTHVSSRIQALLDQQYPSPAFVTGRRWDIVAWNEAAKFFYGDLDSMPIEKRNTFYQLFMSRRYKELLINWDYHAKGIISTLQDIAPERLEDPWFRDLVDRLLKESEEFKTIWKKREIHPYVDGEKSYLFPKIGQLNFEYASLKTMDHRFQNLRIVIFIPSDTTTELRWNQIVEHS